MNSEKQWLSWDKTQGGWKMYTGEGELNFPFCVTRSCSSARMKAGQLCRVLSIPGGGV